MLRFGNYGKQNGSISKFRMGCLASSYLKLKYNVLLTNTSVYPIRHPPHQFGNEPPSFADIYLSFLFFNGPDDLSCCFFNRHYPKHFIAAMCHLCIYKSGFYAGNGNIFFKSPGFNRQAFAISTDKGFGGCISRGVTAAAVGSN